MEEEGGEEGCRGGGSVRRGAFEGYGEKGGEGFRTMLLHYLRCQAIVGRKEGRKGEKRRE